MMKFKKALKILIAVLILYTFNIVAQSWWTYSVEEQFAELTNIYKKSEEEERYFILPLLSKISFELGYLDKAEAYADEVLILAKKYCCDWNYGNAVHDGNMVKGLIAIKQGQVNKAKSYLHQSSLAQTSPLLASAGTDFNLARELLRLGEKASVINYLNNIKGIQIQNIDRIEIWIVKIKKDQLNYLEMY